MELWKSDSNPHTLHDFIYRHSLNRQEQYIVLESKAEVASEGMVTERNGAHKNLLGWWKCSLYLDWDHGYVSVYIYQNIFYIYHI